jgi:sporulation protein YlmC with PRC-barrel domain
MRLSDLLGCEVIGAGGWSHGRVHDLRVCTKGGRAEVEALLVGSPGLKERLLGRGDGKEHPHRVGHGFEVPWSEVRSIDAGKITIEERR